LGSDEGERSALRRWALDGALAARVAMAWLTSALLPRRFWRPLTLTIGKAGVWLRPAWRSAELARLDRYLGPGDWRARQQMLADCIAFGHEARLLGLREHWPGNRAHDIRITGEAVLRDALASGKGVILWVAPFVFASLVTKMGLHAAGYSVSHLSRPTHGFGTSPRAIRWINPVWTKIEERYLRERIVMSAGRQTAALKTLRARLAENQIVSITVGDEGLQTIPVDLLGGTLRLATGPMSLAESSGAPLVPVFTVCTAPGEFTVELQSPLALAGEGGREARFLHVGQQYAQRLAPIVTRFPGQWLR
jgi:lauroyl/myristoyl acyltransferase